MAQTIALQRGTTSVSADGSTIVTLFTNSGGIATRVIVNQIAWYYNATQNSGTTNVLVYHASSGGQTSVIGLYRRQAGSSVSSQFLVGGNGNVWNGTGSNQMIGTIPTIIGGSSGDISNGTPSLDYSSATTSYYSFIPSTFYIGPNDSIKMKLQASAGTGKSFVYRTATISYSFTTITES